MNFNGGMGFIGSGPIVGPITIEGDLKVNGDVEVTGDMKGSTGHITNGFTCQDLKVTDDVIIQGSTNLQDVTGDIMYIANMPMVASAIAIQTLLAASNSLTLAWATYNETESHPSPVTALIPIISNTEQSIQEDGNWMLTFQISITVSGGFTGRVQLLTTRNGVQLAGPINVPIDGDNVYTASWSTTRYFSISDSFKVELARGVSAASNWGIESYFTATRTS